jgi:hypothetical protein
MAVALGDRFEVAEDEENLKALPPPNLPLGRGRNFTPCLLQSEICSLPCQGEG